MTPKLLLQLTGVTLALLAMAIWLSGGVELPTRSPPRQFHFSGPALFTLGASPLCFGFTLLALARGSFRRDSKATQLAIAIGFALLGLSFVLSAKY